MSHTTKRKRPLKGNIVSIIPVNNLRYSIEGYVERRHPEFAYDTGLNRFMADFIEYALSRDFVDEYRVVSIWRERMAIYDEVDPRFIEETLSEVQRRVSRHLAPHTNRYRDKIAWEWVSERQVDIVIYGKPLWT